MAMCVHAFIIHTYYYKIIEDPTIVTKNYFGFSNNTNIYLSSQVLFKLNPNYDKVINNLKYYFYCY